MSIVFIMVPSVLLAGIYDSVKQHRKKMQSYRKRTVHYFE